MSPARAGAPRPDRTPAVSVTAVVVAEGLTDYLSRTLSALAAQTRGPSSILVVDTTPGAVTPDLVQMVQRLSSADRPSSRVTVVAVPGAHTFGHAVRTALDAVGPGDGPHAGQRWLWLLHDDSAPEPAALAELLRAVEIAPSVGIAGCKQRTWSDPPRVVEVGVWTSRFGRRMTGLDAPEVDQGQHDAREDVLAVGIAGALVRRDVWDDLGGTDPALGPYGDGLDLSRRARLAGHRVVVVPSAVVRHAQASIPRGGLLGRPEWDTRRSTQARRAAFLHLQMVGAPTVLVPAVSLLAVLASLVRALGRVAIKEPHLVVAELLAPWVVLGRPERVAAARRRARRSRVLPRRALRPLQARWTEVARQVYDRRLAAAEVRRTRSAPSELELSELAALRSRRRGTLATVVVAALVVTAVALAGLISFGETRVVGGALAYGDARLGELWSSATSWWVTGGLGEPAPPEPFAVVLLPLTALLGTVGQAAVAVLVGAILLAALGAWFAAGAVTRSVALRAWAALVWAAAPALLTSVSGGRVAVVVAHVVLPWFVLGVVRGVGAARVDVVQSGLVGAQRVTRSVPAGADPAAGEPEAAPPGPEGAEPETAEPPAASPAATAEPSVTAAAGAALALAALTAAAPVLLPATLLVLLATALVTPRRGRLAWIALPALVLQGPTIVAALGRAGGWWRVLVAEPGEPVPEAVAPVWQQLLGWPVTPAEWSALSGVLAGQLADGVWVLPLAATGLLLLLAVPGLFLALPAARAARLGWVAAAAGLAAALLAGRTSVGLAESAVVNAATAPGISLMVAGLLAAALVGAARLGDALGARSFGWRQVTVAVVALLAVLGPAATLGVWTWQHRGGQNLAPAVTEVAVVPAVGRQMQQSAEATRVLALQIGPDGTVGATVLRRDGLQVTEGSRFLGVRDVLSRAGDPAELEVADVAARLAVGSTGDVAGDLGRLGLGAVLVVPAGAERNDLVGRLDATPGLERVTETSSGVIWRVDAAGAATTAAWARLVEADESATPEAVASTGDRVDTVIGSGGAGRRLVLAERADPGWRAELDGRPLRAVPTAWRQTFEIGADPGRLVVKHVPVARTPWLVAQATVLALTVLLALPVRRRRGGAR